MLGSIIDIATLCIIALLIVWGVWYAIKYVWTGAETTSAGLLVGKITDTTQAYTMYGLLETMKLDNKVKADANALGAIAYLQSVVLQGVAKDWTKKKPTDVSGPTIDENPADANANSINWSPSDES